MSEELLQRNLLENPEKIGKWDFYNIGATSVKVLKEHNIIRHIDYGVLEKKKIDGLIIQKKKVIAVIEYKRPAEFKTRQQKDKAIIQEIEVAKRLDASMIIATDTQETVWVNVLTGKRIKDELGRELKVNFNPRDEKLPELIEKIKYSINALNDAIKPKQLVNPTDLAKQIWQDIWSVSGATPENCLYTFVELFIFKYLSDLGILGQGIDFDHLIERYGYKLENPEKQVLEYYAGAIRPKIKELFPESLTDKTTIINGTIFVSKDQKAVEGYSTVFKKVLFRFKDYGKLEDIDYDFKSQLFESFLKESISKKNWGQFFTPLKVVRAMVEMAKDDIREGVKICDPACGVGKFLLEPLNTRLDDFYEINKKGIKPKITIHGFDKGFDKDEQKTIILAKANMLIYFSDLIKENPGLTKEFARLFNESFVLKTNSILGTLSDAIENEYDLILTNPPYVTSGSSNLKEEIKKGGNLGHYYKINAMGVEGLFMEWIIRALKPRGKAFVVVPDGIFNRQNDKNLRQFIMDECFIDGIISLPVKTFFTTPKKTYILCLTKKSNKKEIQKDPVFTYLVSEMGESRDIYRFDIEQNDLSESVLLFNAFKGSRDYFTKNNTDKRCKILPIEIFAKSIDGSWIIDNFWTKQEKIELGVLEEGKFVKFEELPDLLEDISGNIISLKNELLELCEKKKFNINYQRILISEIIDFPETNSKITKEFCKKNKGNIPVYASSKNEESVLGYIKDGLKTVKYYENCLSWNRNGSVGYVFIRAHRFSTNEDHRAMILKKEVKEDLLPEYLKFEIEATLFRNGFSYLNKCGVDKIKNVCINIPINSLGEFDLETQKEIAEKYQKIEDIKTAINKELNKIIETEIDFE